METPTLLSHRILFLSEPITAEVANRLIAQLLLLDADIILAIIFFRAIDETAA